MTFLAIENVGKRFGHTTALDGVSLGIERGSFVALLGPSGCGKSTLLRIIAGLETPTFGRITVDGEDITRLPPERRRLAMMFQSYALLPHMTALENVRFPLRMQGREGAAEQRRRAMETLALVGLDHLAERLPREMSGGQQQRVALARAIIAEPRVLLLDEPLSNLDARLREDMQIELQALHRRLGLTTLFVTHDQEEALSLADRVVLLNQGRIDRDATADALYDDPGTAFAADFLGAANLVPVTVEATEDGHTAILEDGQRLQLASAPGPGPRQLVLRQEDITLADPSEPGLEATIEARIFLGTRVRYLVRLGDLRLRVLAPRHLQYPPGTPVRLQIDPANCRWSREGP
ncbi:MAG: ABC transporter ATP-binding protein [Geminicoccaceae bacterium]|jgi:ABC-type Fe3+/spermidine/putrescine transport system ATPase subunit|nr:ABC transporter ATP-binding protein [Geminicoccaceae bacterium]HRY27212.1 ABC transporter ATP-binding protein [Geminicoccaceae bacterium]